MFRLHCNKCYHLRSQEPTLALHLSRCHHIICANCLEQSSLEDPKKCPLCSQPLQTIPIDRNMPSGMAQYFEDPTRFLKLYQKISKFQCDQRTSDNVGFWQQTERQRDLELQLQGYNKIEMQLNQQIKQEKRRIEEMRKYIEYHDKAAAAPSGSSSSSHRGRRGSRSSSQGRGSRPHTPSVTTTITDNSMEKENNFFMDTTADDFGPKKRRNDKNFHI